MITRFRDRKIRRTLRVMNVMNLMIRKNLNIVRFRRNYYSRSQLSDELLSRYYEDYVKCNKMIKISDELLTLDEFAKVMFYFIDIHHMNILEEV